MLSFWREITGAGDLGSSFATWSAIAAIIPALSVDAFPLAENICFILILPDNV